MLHLLREFVATTYKIINNLLVMKEKKAPIPKMLWRICQRLQDVDAKPSCLCNA
jgi:hypothetical protein